ncbi:MAG TPA: hypothetical protein VM934_00790 [Pyrinomonadaceae bacterium]|jgi:uncharacterized protein (TIGR02588 family)|nr:hypothetical protein [Pyrinomonadaceae bacterium]
MNIEQNKNWLEWVVFSISLVLVAGTLGYLVYSGATMKDATPSIEVSLGPPEARGQHFAVPVTVTNVGDQTAEGVQIEVTLEGGGEKETGEFAIAFVPRKAKREGFVTFGRDPRGGVLSARVLGYEKP